MANTFAGINRYAFIASGQNHFRHLAKDFLVGQFTICLQYLEFMMVNDKVSRELQQFANLILGKSRNDLSRVYHQGNIVFKQNSALSKG